MLGPDAAVGAAVAARALALALGTGTTLELELHGAAPVAAADAEGTLVDAAASPAGALVAETPATVDEGPCAGAGADTASDTGAVGTAGALDTPELTTEDSSAVELGPVALDECVLVGE